MRAAFVAIVAGLVGHAARLMVEKEYPSWAPVLASLLVRVAADGSVPSGAGNGGRMSRQCRTREPPVCGKQPST